MSGKSNYAENYMLDSLYGSGTPATIYCALFVSDPTDAASGTEVTGSGYARVAKTNNTTNFPNASNGVKVNGTAIAFPTATGDWSSAAPITHWAYFDASTSGNMLHYGPLAASRVVQNGDQLTLPANTGTEITET